MIMCQEAHRWRPGLGTPARHALSEAEGTRAVSNLISRAWEPGLRLSPFRQHAGQERHGHTARWKIDAPHELAPRGYQNLAARPTDHVHIMRAGLDDFDDLAQDLSLGGHGFQ